MASSHQPTSHRSPSVGRTLGRAKPLGVFRRRDMVRPIHLSPFSIEGTTLDGAKLLGVLRRRLVVRLVHLSPFSMGRNDAKPCQSSSMRRQSPVKADLAASTLGDFNARCRASIRTLVAPPQWGPVHVGVRPDPVLQSQRRAPVHRGQESSVAVTRTRTVERLKISSGRRRSRVPPPFQAGSVRRVLCSGSYTSPVIHRWCSSTASFRATATTARFLAFFPPRAARASPLRRRSVSGPKGPRM
jgi:hypothetical protein